MENPTISIIIDLNGRIESVRGLKGGHGAIFSRCCHRNRLLTFEAVIDGDVEVSTRSVRLSRPSPSANCRARTPCNQDTDGCSWLSAMTARTPNRTYPWLPNHDLNPCHSPFPKEPRRVCLLVVWMHHKSWSPSPALRHDRRHQNELSNHPRCLEQFVSQSNVGKSTTGHDPIISAA